LIEQQRKALIDSAAVAAYPAETDFQVVVRILVCDDSLLTAFVFAITVGAWVGKPPIYPISFLLL
jgi:hypothetical protein